MHDGQGVYWGMSTASETFLTFTTELYSCLRIIMHYFLYVDKEGSIATGTQPPLLPSRHFWWVVNRKIVCNKTSLVLQSGCPCRSLKCPELISQIYVLKKVSDFAFFETGQLYHIVGSLVSDKGHFLKIHVNSYLYWVSSSI